MHLAAQDVHEGIVGYLNNLLSGRKAPEHIGLQGFLTDARYEITRHAEVDIRLKQRHAYLSQRSINIALGQPALVSKATEYTIQLFRQCLEHL